MKRFSPLKCCTLSLLLATSVVAEEIKLGNFRAVGQSFSNARLVKKDEQHATIAHETGVTKVSLLALPRLVQERINFYPEDYCLKAHYDRLKDEKANETMQTKLAEQMSSRSAENDLAADLAIKRSITKTENLQQEADRSFWRGLLQPKDQRKYRFKTDYKSRSAQYGNLIKKPNTTTVAASVR